MEGDWERGGSWNRIGANSEPDRSRARRGTERERERERRKKEKVQISSLAFCLFNLESGFLSRAASDASELLTHSLTPLYGLDLLI